MPHTTWKASPLLLLHARQEPYASAACCRLLLSRLVPQLRKGLSGNPWRRKM